MVKGNSPKENELLQAENEMLVWANNYSSIHNSATVGAYAIRPYKIKIF